MARRVVGAVVLLLALAGCGGGPKADPSPSPSPSTSPVSTTPSVSASVPAMPDAAKENSKPGAIAFVRYYIDLFNAAQATGSTDGLAAFSAATCEECSRVASALRLLYGAGGHIDGGALKPGPATAQSNRADHVWLVLIRIESGPQVVVRSAGAQPENLPGGSRAMQFSIARQSGSWKVAQWARR